MDGIGIGSEAPVVVAKVEAPDAAAAAAAAGNPDKTNGGGNNGSVAAPAANLPSPETENLEFAKAKGWANEDGTFKSVDILKGYQTLEKHLGKTVVVPDDTASQDERDAFAKRIGWPGDVKGYELAVPKNLPDNVPYNSQLADWFKGVANEARLPTKAAQTLHDKFVEFQVKSVGEDVAAMAQQIEKAAVDAIPLYVKEWGDPETPAHKQNVEAARRALSDPKLAGLEKMLKANGLLTPKGHFTSFEIGHLLASHGKAFLNDTFIAPNAANGADPAGNVFQKKLSDGTPNPAFNATTQGALVKQNPQEARRLILLAGENPADYQL